MLNNITPEQAGLEGKYVTAFLKEMQENGINFHSMLMLRGNEIFFEKYWEPFDANTPHRMYSITKSFVAIAIVMMWIVDSYILGFMHLNLANIFTGFVCGVELWSFLENAATISRAPLFEWLGRWIKRRVGEEVGDE